jgi:hypothetical protein
MATVIGVALGQKRSPTAVSVVQGERRSFPDPGPHFNVRHLERLPAGTSFPDAARRVGEIARSVASRTGWRPEVFVDVTGLGDPILALVKRRVLRVTGVYFNHGDRRLEEQSSEVRLGKAWLVARLQALLQTAVLHLPRTPDAEDLARELLDYEIRVTEDANDRYGAFRVGTHDDLVTALGLAVQEDPPVPSSPMRRLVFG